MSIIDIVLHEDGDTSHFVELERSDTHASIGTVAADTVEQLTGYRRVHIGLQDLINHAPVVAFDDLPPMGVVVTATGSIVQFDRRFSHKHYAFLRNHEPLRLLHTNDVTTES